MEDGGWKKKESPSVKLALAMALVRSNRHLNLNQPLNVLSPSATSDQIRHWKKKAKDRKSEIVHLREEIKLLQDGSGCELEPPIASCRCHFFEGCGDVGPHVTDGTTGDEHWIDNVLRRRFIRLVRWKERRRRVERPIERRSFMEFESDDEIARLSTSIDFLVGLSDNVLAKGEVDASFSTFSHQAIDFILASLKNILVSRQQKEPLEEITNGLIMRLIKRMCTPSPSQGDSQIDSGSGLDNDMDPQFCVQHIIRKLGKEEFIGQRTMLTLSQKIAIVAENLLLLDPFHDNYPNLDASMFLLIQLIEFMISDYIRTWLNSEQFDKKLFEEWVRSILKARKDLEILENMNGLYILYMDRVVALLAKEVGPATHRGKLDPQVFSKLLS
ncbi:multipolar spindle 1 [Carex rostrata]